MAAKTRNTKVKAFLKKLASEEIGHKEFITMHKESIYNDGHWYGWDHVRIEM
jgi:rubrerythrin